MESVIEKFMETMGITYDIEQTRRLIYAGKPSACYTATAYYKGKKEYEQHHCYSRRSDGTIIYEEGNEVIGPDKGVFVYLGTNPDVRRFFEVKARQMAKQFLENY